MNVTIPEKEKLKKRTIVIYIIAAIICVLAVVVVVESQVLGNDVVNQLFGINKLIKRTEQEEASLKTNFENLFDNTLENANNTEYQKIYNTKDVIFTNYKKEEVLDSSEVNVNLPFINLKDKEAQEFNQEIENIFQAKTEEIINQKSENTIYTVKYKAVVQNNILSLIIYSDLKQGASPQRVIIQTFNYDLEENKKLSLSDVANIYNYYTSDIQKKINDDIKEEQQKTDDLKQLGYNVFSRDLESDIYKVENVTEFFVYNNNIYIIFAYGNDQITSEMDLVII